MEADGAVLRKILGANEREVGVTAFGVRVVQWLAGARRYSWMEVVRNTRPVA